MAAPWVATSVTDDRSNALRIAVRPLARKERFNVVFEGQSDIRHQQMAPLASSTSRSRSA
jgi:hypothetical protein